MSEKLIKALFFGGVTNVRLSLTLLALPFFTFINFKNMKNIKNLALLGEFLEGIALLLMIVFFTNEGLNLVDIDIIFPKNIQIILMGIMIIGCVFMANSLIKQTFSLKLREKPIPLPNKWLLIIILIMATLVLYLPSVVLENIGEKIFVYFVFGLILGGAILHRYYEVGKN